ncbi:MAG: hypothetical protein JW909_02555 [Planctomycetes bacterium]|nr:hypothetical protein [Planctomycetota bacterium]
MSCRFLEKKTDDLGGDGAPSLQVQRDVCSIRCSDAARKQAIDDALHGTEFRVLISTDQCPISGQGAFNLCPFYEPS